jgi:hypothetical protein
MLLCLPTAPPPAWLHAGGHLRHHFLMSSGSYMQTGSDPVSWIKVCLWHSDCCCNLRFDQSCLGVSSWGLVNSHLASSWNAHPVVGQESLDSTSTCVFLLMGLNGILRQLPRAVQWAQVCKGPYHPPTPLTSHLDFSGHFRPPLKQSVLKSPKGSRIKTCLVSANLNAPTYWDYEIERESQVSFLSFPCLHISLLTVLLEWSSTFFASYPEFSLLLAIWQILRSGSQACLSIC